MLITDLLLGPDCVGEAIADTRSASATSIAHARAAGVRLWLAAGAVGAYRNAAPSAGALADFAAGCQWLSTLACDLDPQDEDPTAGVLARGAVRLGSAARLLSRRAGCVAPETLLATALDPQPVAFIDLAAQQDRIRPELERRIHAVLRHGHYIMGPEIAELESRLAAYAGVKHCITCASGTDSLEIAMRALGIGPGDEVITVPFTWISTTETIALVGATPVFVDIDPATFNLDARRLAAAITPRTKAIMPVSLFGQMPDLEAISAIAGCIPVIEDGAQSFGATRHGRRSCAASTIGSTSFFPAKPLGCYGDGGALFSDDDVLAARMRAIRTHGGEKRHHHPYIGMNGRLDTLQAAIVLAKLEVWDDEVAARGRIGARYSDGIARLRPAATAPAVARGNTHVYAQYTIRVPDRDAVAARLQQQGIPTAVYYPKCLHEQPCFASLGHRPGAFPESERASREVLSLPMHARLDPGIQDRIIAALPA